MVDKMVKSIIVKGQANRVYNLWSDVENFPNFMHNIKSVKKTGEKTTHWVMEGPMGKNLEWDAKITDDQPNKRIAWHSTKGNIKTSGAVDFNQLDKDETQVTVMMQFVPPAGRLGDLAAHFFDNPDKRLDEDLKNFKKFVEAIPND